MYNVYYTFHVFDVNVDGNDLYIIHTFCQNYQVKLLILASVSLNQESDQHRFVYHGFSHFLCSRQHILSGPHDDSLQNFSYNQCIPGCVWIDLILSELSIFLRHSLNIEALNVFKSLFNGAELSSLTDIFRQKVALVYQVAFSKNVIKHYSPALARVDGTVCEQ